MTRIVLVTGTDTGVGKTFVSCALLGALRRAGARVAARKPVETGCALRSGELHPADGAALAEAAGGLEPLARVCPIRFAEPLAPAVAAARAGTTIDVPRLVAEARATASSVDTLLVEGAGGLLVPIALSAAGCVTYADLALDLGAALIVVVGARLGAINHTLLTLEVAARRGIPILGTIINHFAADDDRDAARQTLAQTLCTVSEVPLLGEVPFEPSETAVEAHMKDAEAHIKDALDRLLPAARR